MIRKIDIIAAARAIVKRNEGYTLPVLIHPRRDWWIGLVAFAVVVIGGSLVLARMYVVFQSVDQLEGAEASQIPRYQAEVVADVNRLYENRQATFDTLVAAAARVAPASVAEDTATTSIETDTTTVSEPVGETELSAPQEQ